MLSVSKTAVVVCALLLAACASGPKYAQMKSSMPPLAADQARIYFYRTSKFVGDAIQPKVMLNSQEVGYSQPGGFFYVDRPPGRYQVYCGSDVDDRVTFVVSAGEERYVRTAAVSSWQHDANVIPQVVDAAEAAVTVQGLRYAPGDTSRFSVEK